MTYDPMTVLNLVMALAVLAAGILGYKRMKSMVSLLVGIGFGLFAIAHMTILLGIDSMLYWFDLIIRVAGYLIVIYALLIYLDTGAAKKKK